MSHFKMFTWLNEYQDLGQLSYDNYVANSLKWWSVYTIHVFVYRFIYSYKSIFFTSLFNYDSEVICLLSSGIEFCYSYIQRLVGVEIE